MKYSCVETRWSLGGKAEFVVAAFCNTSLSIIACLSLESTAPALPKNVNLNCLQLSVVPSKLFGFPSSRVSTTSLHDGNQLHQCLQSIFRGHIANTTVQATKRPTTDQFVEIKLAPLPC